MDMGMIPGASRRSRSSPIRIHLSALVTPGFAALWTTLRFSNRLMIADFPMFGKPMTHARTGRGFSPLLTRLAFTFLLMLAAARWTFSVPCPSFPLVKNA